MRPAIREHPERPHDRWEAVVVGSAWPPEDEDGFIRGRTLARCWHEHRTPESALRCGDRLLRRHRSTRSSASIAERERRRRIKRLVRRNTLTCREDRKP